MDGLLLLGVGLLGLAVGVVLTLALRRVLQPHEPHPDPAEPELDEGTTAVLAALRSATVVVSVADGRVVRSSPEAHAFAVVRGDRVAHASVEELIAAVARDGTVRDADVELPRGPVGSGTVALALRVAPLGETHVLVLAEDRTEARRVEAIRRDFVVNVSHELKTPVGALSLLAETVEEAAGDPVAVRRFAGRIQTEATRLSALVHEIIELSRLQVVDALREAEPVDLGEVLSEAVDRARTKAVAREIAIDLGADPGVVVLGDRDLLVTAVRNLLDNAVAYSDAGTRVAVGTSVRREQGLVEVAVVDQGMGIPAEAQPRLFERFYRVDPARSRDTGGTGLGLSIVKHVATDHGGDVAVWSEPGRGSTFTIRLPVAHVPGDDPQDVTDTSTDEGARR
ncbi:two-component sensor histidine kinase [Actinotalea sp. BY-33]|uniref:Sensor-like histidine kinase SenX3 n=1 Tax=Actinotalea soli TaxID=2819234 RepID=A0A939RSZ3_9CELL|nr:two-component sensor histidine kinase [Actinotalea soli]